MNKLLVKFKINFIKMYRYIVSPMLGNNCRYLTSCSQYYIESLQNYGLIKGSYMGVKRVLSCHPVKFLGGGSSFDFVPKNNRPKKENLNG